MVQENVGFRKNKTGRILLISVSFLLAVLLCCYILLFHVNSFQLTVLLNGDADMEILQGESFHDPGVGVELVGSVFFREGISLDIVPVCSGMVNGEIPGTYALRYQVSLYSLEASAERCVHVVDTTPPEITLLSIPGSFTAYGEQYEEEGYSAWDNVDGDLTDLVYREERDGLVFYSVTDQTGNRTTVCRKILFVDITAPELMLLGENAVYVRSGEGYSDPGCTALDTIDGDLTGRVKVDGFVDKYLAGSYQLRYTVKDNSGNVSEIYRTVVVQPKELPETAYPSGKVIYLTFDDGPGPYTKRLLEILDKYDAKATFFVVNTEQVNVIADIVDGGHSIGIHSVTHTYRDIYASADAYFNDLLTMQQIIYEISGVTTYLMRFPGGSSNTVSCFNPGIMTYLTQAVEDMGFRYFDWNVDSADAGGAKDAEDVFANVTSGAEQRRISIVLQHDIKGFSVEAVEKILIWGKEHGYRFLGLDMTSPTAHHGVNN